MTEDQEAPSPEETREAEILANRIRRFWKERGFDVRVSVTPRGEIVSDLRNGRPVRRVGSL